MGSKIIIGDGPGGRDWDESGDRDGDDGGIKSLTFH